MASARPTVVFPEEATPMTTIDPRRRLDRSAIEEITFPGPHRGEVRPPVKCHHDQVTGNEREQAAHSRKVPDPREAQAAEGPHDCGELNRLVQREPRRGEDESEDDRRGI